ncbi:MAG: FtsQ-type POTRA domain-containing protein [Alphaproteobacteria bacterium]|nr:FtsQ-type POTRA domain-containing protein [Alphaproteobacteria bacterium]
MRRVKKQDAQNARRQQPRRRWLKPVLLVSLILAGSGSAAFGLWWLDQQGHFRRANDMAHKALNDTASRLGLVVADITVEGRKRQEPEAILAALGLKRGDPILTADLPLVRARLENLAWVKQATVERRLPGHVHIRLVEREPMAQWQRSGRFVLVDRDGAEIGPDATGEFAHLPVIVGPDAPQHASALFAALSAEPDLAGRVKAAVRVGNRRWNVKLDDIAAGVDVRLPEAQTAAAWSRLARLERDHQLLERNLLMIDLRLPDRLVVGTPNDPEGRTETGKKTKTHDKDA